MRLAVDVGGTFIDFVYHDETTGDVRTEKVRSAGTLSGRLIEGIRALGADAASLPTIVHGSTMVLNSIVQEKGARVGLVTTKGFRDVLELARGNRVEIYNLFYKQATPLVPRYLRMEVSERINFRGEIVEVLDERELKAAVEVLVGNGVDSIAVCFLNAYANPEHERAAARFVNEHYPDVFVSISSDIVRERREFERTSTTVLNAFTRPRFSGYLDQVGRRLEEEGFAGALTVMQSTGGITSTEIASRTPVRVVQSGPAGGVIGAMRLSQLIDEANIVVGDLGGTTFDVSLICGGQYSERSDVSINRRPIMQPSIDIVSIGAGGGSIVTVDEEGGLRVGPESAQAEPGPICYGFGGKQITLTDALVTLGYFDPAVYMGGRITLDTKSAEAAINAAIASPLNLSCEQAASGIVRIATTNMAYAIRQVTIERGFDPREFSMLCIGGGCGLFAGGLLDELDFKSVIVPNMPAVFSAWGLLNADYREDVSRTLLTPLDEAGPLLAHAFEEMEERARAALATTTAASIRIERFCEMRYAGQAHTIKVAVPTGDVASSLAGLAGLRARFEEAYARQYRHILAESPLEITAVRLAAIGETGKPQLSEVPARHAADEASLIGTRDIHLGREAERLRFELHDRSRLRCGDRIAGPAVIEEWNSTVIVNPAQQATVDRYGNLMLEKLK
ncbi:hydantoinase/oxoprolinase family protein [Ensifer sp. HO-A22]|uniref:Hydantoinase/oxoprolinase family protein n=1 Tax=Ensifer oleiphilus TaxID=2742698 RepID=A0A7Y6QDF2_9HYPH|nr:hydantoinase/oxoprolinase family protein [Ensifer oleiphilus]NVD43375.1 hydantoinase/oxoprolinase family protein [Ensifer oleiphilus]